MSDRKPDGDITDVPDEFEGARLLGIRESGKPVYYDPVEHVKIEGDRHPKEELADWTRTQLVDELTVEELIEDIRAGVGWSELTEFAKEHLGGESTESEGERGSDHE